MSRRSNEGAGAARRDRVCGATKPRLFFAVLLLSFALPSLGQELRHNLSIDAQSTSSALKALAEQTGLQVLILSQDAAGKRSPDVHGNLTNDEALQRILDNTGLTYQKIDDNTVAIRRRGPTPVATVDSTRVDVAQSLEEVAAPAVGAGDVETSEAAASSATQLQEVVVTGTLIIRNGYEAPTPETVVSDQQLESDTATTNIADTMNNMMPVFRPTSNDQAESGGVSSAAQGIDALNLRDLGTNRVLVLFDGHRSVGSDFSNDVDISDFPQQLIQRVDVVTGGGSSVYGSDAIAGVVNFVLNKTFTGFVADVSGGETTYGDDKNSDLQMTGGWGFDDNRGHVELSGQITQRAGVTPGTNARPWEQTGWGIMNNPNYAAGNGQPYEVVGTNISVDNATPGGIIFSGPLRGTYFGQGGVPYQFQYGPLTDDPWTQGGQWYSTVERNGPSGTLEPENKRRGAFSRFSFDLTDHVNVYAQLSYNTSTTSTATWPEFEAGNGAVIYSGNPFIPSSVQTQMTADGLSSFQIGSLNWPEGIVEDVTTRQTNRYVLGAEGNFSLLNYNNWTWSAYAQYGVTKADTDVLNVRNTSNYLEAINAVRAPNGNIVCAVTLNPSLAVPGASPGCVPYDPLGLGVVSQAALDYVNGESRVDQIIEQVVYDATVQGEPVADWAGPVSVAVDVQHRDDMAEGLPWGEAFFNEGGSFFAGNFTPFVGNNAVTEGSLETLVPLAKNMAGAQELNIDGAVRVIDYRYSGTVETWKYGFTWSPIPDLRFRGTRSYDIRAPTLSDLFNYANNGEVSAFDPFCNCTPEYYGYTEGNKNLKPEKGNTNEIGVVFSPTFFPGFQASVDYWHISLTDAIATLSASELLDFCYEGEKQYCGQIYPNPLVDPLGPVTKIVSSEFNLAAETLAGIDYEADYTKRLEDLSSALKGQFGWRLLVSQYLEAMENTGLGVGPNNIYSVLGDEGQETVGPAHWHLTTSLNYALDQWQASLTGRLQSAGVIDDRYIQCSTNCPTAIPTQNIVTITDNHIPGFFYLDGSFAYSFNVQEKSTLQIYFNVRNIFNRAPGIVPAGPTDYTYTEPLSKDQDGFDLLGREYRLGFRYRL